MRKSGLAKADKKAGRVAAEGVIASSSRADGKLGRAGRGQLRDRLRRARATTSAAFAADVAKAALAASGRRTSSADGAQAAERRDASRDAPRAGREDRREHRRAPLRRSVEAPAAVGTYVHGDRIGALVALEGGDDELARDLAMQVAAINPRYLTPARRAGGAWWPRSARSVEQAQATRSARQAGGDRRQDGRRQGAQVAQRDRAHRASRSSRTTKLTVEQAAARAQGGSQGFQRYEVGAGIEKKQDDFVAEVMAQVRPPRPGPTQPDLRRNPAERGSLSCATASPRRIP